MRPSSRRPHPERLLDRANTDKAGRPGQGGNKDGHVLSFPHQSSPTVGVMTQTEIQKHRKPKGS